MTNHAWASLTISVAFLVLAATIAPRPVMAQEGVNFYSTAAASGTENYAIVDNSGGFAPEPARLISACNYNVAAPEVVMVFDASALPANGSVPKMQLPLPAANGASAPSCGSFSLPAGGVTFYTGLLIAASTSGKTLTIDTTSGGNTFFEVGR